MKNLILLLCLSLIGFVSKAQVTLYSQYNKTTDTINTSSSTATKNLTTATNALNTIGQTGAYDVQLVVTSVSGTPNFKAILQSSIDGVNFSNHFKNAGTNGIMCDTLSVGAATNHIWTIPKSNATQTNNTGRRLYFRVACVAPSSTQSSIIQAKLITQE